MTRQAYLTIDDSPTKNTDLLTDWLMVRNIPAVFFCVGGAYKDMHIDNEGIEQNPDPVKRAIEKGFVVGNHAYTHTRASEISYETMVEEIEKTEKLIDGLYRQAGKARPVKLMRFPYLDRGCGPTIVDYDAAGEFGDKLRRFFDDGLNAELYVPSPEQVEKKARLQEYLKREGFSTAVFEDVTFPWYQGEMRMAYDVLCTYSLSDWMVNPELECYAENWPYRSLDALKKKIDEDLDLQNHTSRHIVLAHDHDPMFDITTRLIEHMQRRGIEFVPISI